MRIIFIPIIILLLEVVFVAGSDLALAMRGWQESFAVVVVARTDGDAKLVEQRNNDNNDDDDSSVLQLVTKGNIVVMTHDVDKCRLLVAAENEQLAEASSSAVARGEEALLPDAVLPLYRRFLGLKERVDDNDNNN
jgi:hypothetical protein